MCVRAVHGVEHHRALVQRRVVGRQVVAVVARRAGHDAAAEGSRNGLLVPLHQRD
jgi:hypothetical protein